MVPARPPSARAVLALAAVLAAVALAGCAAVGGRTTTVSTTTERTPAISVVHEILGDSDRVAAVLVTDTYTYRKGCFDRSDDTAVAYVRTGFRYVETDDGGREAVGGTVYRVEMIASERRVTSVREVDAVPDGFTVRGEC
jgi:hypothetical protein